MSGRSITGEQAILQIEAKAAVYGVVRTHDSNGRPRYEVTCGVCQTKDGVFNASLQHAEQILSHFRRKGWMFTRGAHPYCSTEHERDAKRIAKREKERLQEEMKHPIRHATYSSPPPPPPPPPVIEAPVPDPVILAPPPPVVTAAVPSNPQITIQVVTLLNEHFDKSKRLFLPGWSDERIAKEVGTSLTFVVGYREVGYGKLAEDPIATKFRTEIKALEDKVAGLALEVGEMKAKLDRYLGGHHKALG
jgi:hypothetical protein